jgi:CHAD domain-containing protein
VRLDPDATLEDVSPRSPALRRALHRERRLRTRASIEGVHQMRVGVRRRGGSHCSSRCCRRAAALLRSDCAGSRELGAARDLDVFTRDLLADRCAALAVCSARAPALDPWRCARSATGACACRSSRRYARLVLELGEWISARGGRSTHRETTRCALEPARGFAEAELERRHPLTPPRGTARRIRRCAPRLRIEAEEARYASEFNDLYRGRSGKRRAPDRAYRARSDVNDVATAEGSSPRCSHAR